MEEKFISTSSEETFALGKSFGAGIRPGSVIAFFGDLAAGKTTFIKGCVEGASG